MNKILLMALVLGTLSTTNVLAATDMATTISSTSSNTATSEAKTHHTKAYGMQSVTAVPISMIIARYYSKVMVLLFSLALRNKQNMKPSSLPLNTLKI